MQTKNLIQSTANIIRITSLAKGNVLKIIEEQSYGSPSLKYGVVLDLFNSGEKTFVQIIEYSIGYQEIKAEIKIYGGDKEIILFPATLEEVSTYFKDAVDNIARSIEIKKEELSKLEQGLTKAIEFMSGEMGKKLTLVNFEEVKSLV